jgi:hypothetical protein
MIQLIANPSKYHGKWVQIHGYLHVRFEDYAIYFSKESADHLWGCNGFWVDFDKTAISYDGAKQFDGKHVLIEGTFDKDDYGHLGLWKGAITKVNRICAD